jgi:large subunit ribosomal protein L3
MKGIVGRKLGMTQVFDEETGSVEAVTVIEAGPCPVVTLRTQAADGYDAVQLAFEPVVDRKLSKGELGHLRKAGVNGHRHLVEFRGPSELQVGESVTVESFEPGDRV